MLGTCATNYGFQRHVEEPRHEAPEARIRKTGLSQLQFIGKICGMMRAPNPADDRAHENNSRQAPSSVQIRLATTNVRPKIDERHKQKHGPAHQVNGISNAI